MGRVLGAVTFATLVAISWTYADVRIAELLSAETAAGVGRFLSGLFPPDLSAPFLGVVLRAVRQTLAIAVAATILSIAMGLPLAVLTCGTLWRRGILVEYRGGRGAAARIMSSVSATLRGLLGFIRAIPDILWAILFVTMVGLGPLAGTLALAVAYSGLIGRVYADAFDTVDPQPLEALQSTGAGRLQIFLRGVWPQALPTVTAYTLYSFECSVRAASVLGLVGGGGIGYEIGISMRLFDYGQVLTLIVAFVVLLALTDVVSQRLRAVLQRRDGANPPQAAPAAGPHRRLAAIRRASVTLALATAGCASFYASGFTPDVFEQTRVLAHAGRFIGDMIPPDLSWPLLSRLTGLALQTFSIAFLGTIIGAVLGLPMALPATASLILLPAEGTGRYSPIERTLRRGAFWTARLTLNVMRAIPELVWVLVCIIAIGIGPFAGTIAIGLHTAGVLGKLYAEVMEEVPRRPVEALYALGATPLQVFMRAVWPQARPMLRNYTVLRWEANLRVSTILGLVGGGGLGQAIYNDIQLGFYDRVATMVLLVYGLVIATDWLSDRLFAATSAAAAHEPVEFLELAPAPSASR